MKRHIKKSLILALLFLVPLNVYATGFWVSGNIVRTLSDGMNYGGCMIQLSQAVNNSCPANGWVSLDCNGGYHRAGERNYASALMAFSLNKSVSVYVDNSMKYNSYCVATRIDVLN